MSNSKVLRETDKNLNSSHSMRNSPKQSGEEPLIPILFRRWDEHEYLIRHDGWTEHNASIALREIGEWAKDKDLSFTWCDAVFVSKAVRDLFDSHKDGKNMSPETDAA